LPSGLLFGTCQIVLDEIGLAYIRQILSFFKHFLTLKQGFIRFLDLSLVGFKRAFDSFAKFLKFLFILQCLAD